MRMFCNFRGAYRTMTNVSGPRSSDEILQYLVTEKTTGEIAQVPIVAMKTTVTDGKDKEGIKQTPYQKSLHFLDSAIWGAVGAFSTLISIATGLFGLAGVGFIGAAVLEARKELKKDALSTAELIKQIESQPKAKRLLSIGRVLASSGLFAAYSFKQAFLSYKSATQEEREEMMAKRNMDLHEKFGGIPDQVGDDYESDSESEEDEIQTKTPQNKQPSVRKTDDEDLLFDSDFARPQKGVSGGIIDDD